MKRGKIALFFTCFFGLIGCDYRPYMDLNKPIYMITDPSLFAGCEESDDGVEACREERLQIVRNGVDDWFDHFNESSRPQVILVASRREVPVDARNTPIHLRISPGACDDSCGKHWACFQYGYNQQPAMVFEDVKYLTPRMAAHEFGHVLGVDHEDVPEGRNSVMTRNPSAYVVPLDIDILCQIHDECPPHENTWCEGGFYDPCRCPSASFEDGEAMRAAGEIVCE